MGITNSDLWELMIITLIGTDFFHRKLPPKGMTNLEYRLTNKVRAENYYRVKKDLDNFWKK